MNLLRAFFLVSEIIVITGIVYIINIDMKLSLKFSLILSAIMTMGLVYMICDTIGWHIWKRKCDKELAKNLENIRRN